MSWLTDFVRPKLQALVSKKDVPDNLWQKCPACAQMLFYRDLSENHQVCIHCQHHLRLPAADRLKMMFDEGKFKTTPLPAVIADPLKFRDRKRYTDRLKEARGHPNRDAQSDALMIGSGKIGGLNTVVAAFDFTFMGGSMGVAVGEGLVLGAEQAIKEKAAYIVVTSSGGARMQEGILSLMQMPRSIVALNRVKRAKLPYIVILADPTTGGVSASFAMLGDVTIAEPGAIVGFAGARVIQETIRQELPEGFQRAEYLFDHGMLDLVVPRARMREELARVLDVLMVPQKSERALLSSFTVGA